MEDKYQSSDLANISDLTENLKEIKNNDLKNISTIRQDTSEILVELLEKWKGYYLVALGGLEKIISGLDREKALKYIPILIVLLGLAFGGGDSNIAMARETLDLEEEAASQDRDVFTIIDNRISFEELQKKASINPGQNIEFFLSDKLIKYLLGESNISQKEIETIKKDVLDSFDTKYEALSFDSEYDLYVLEGYGFYIIPTWKQVNITNIEKKAEYSYRFRWEINEIGQVRSWWGLAQTLNAYRDEIYDSLEEVDFIDENEKDSLFDDIIDEFLDTGYTLQPNDKIVVQEKSGSEWYIHLLSRWEDINTGSLNSKTIVSYWKVNPEDSSNLMNYRLTSHEENIFLEYKDNLEHAHDFLTYMIEADIDVTENIVYLYTLFSDVVAKEIENWYIYDDRWVIEYDTYVSYIEQIYSMIYEGDRPRWQLGFGFASYINFVEYVANEINLNELNRYTFSDIDLYDLENNVYDQLVWNSKEEKRAVIKYLQEKLDATRYNYETIQRSDIYSIVFWESYFDHSAVSWSGAEWLFQLTSSAINHYYDNNPVFDINKPTFIDWAKTIMPANTRVALWYLRNLEYTELISRLDNNHFNRLYNKSDNIYQVISNKARGKGVEIDKSDIEELLSKLAENTKPLEDSLTDKRLDNWMEGIWANIGFDSNSELKDYILSGMNEKYGEVYLKTWDNILVESNRLFIYSSDNISSSWSKNNIPKYSLELGWEYTQLWEVRPGQWVDRMLWNSKSRIINSLRETWFTDEDDLEEKYRDIRENFRAAMDDYTLQPWDKIVAQSAWDLWWGIHLLPREVDIENSNIEAKSVASVYYQNMDSQLYWFDDKIIVEHPYQELLDLYNITYRYNWDTSTYWSDGEIFEHRNYFAIKVIYTSRRIFEDF